MRNLTFILLIASLTCPDPVFSQNEPSTYVDKNGIMRWTSSDIEINEFGVNYTVPFAHAYRAHQYLNVSHEQAILDDIYHLSRLGLNALRVHVWDWEISDSLGNLLENDHLRLLDYTIKNMKDRGFTFVLTPLAFWGNGYPERDVPTIGFSCVTGGKDVALTDPDAIAAQIRYINRFVSHINPYTGIAYKDDPDIIAFEISNEPHHAGSPEETTEYINNLVESVRATGCKKPLFYNMSFSSHLLDAYTDADIQGGTVQWYATGLVQNHMKQGNYLPDVDDFPKDHISDHIRARKKALLIYEFDAADVGYSCLYPMMARGFREDGYQFAAHFSYDPVRIAYANTEYQTHYVNLAYTPKKALSLMIAGEVFKEVPLWESFGEYPEDTSFYGFRVSYEEDLSEMATEEKFIYSNNTRTMPPAPERLNLVAGYGNSPLVTYGGCGAYFLDRLEPGIWRLEVMPDAIWVRDPFERASLKKEVSVIIRSTWPMKVDLPDLGKKFTIHPLDQEILPDATSVQGEFDIFPGAYLLVREGVNSSYKPTDRWNNRYLGEFIAPPTTCTGTYVLHDPCPEVTAGSPVSISLRVVAPVKPESVELIISENGRRSMSIPLEDSGPYGFRAEIPGDRVRTGYLNYYIAVRSDGNYHTYPSGVEGNPGDWDFYDRQTYTSRVVPPGSPVCIFSSARDGDMIIRPQRRARVRYLPAPSHGESMVIMDPGNLESFSYYFRDRVAGRNDFNEQKTSIVLYGRSLDDASKKIKVSLVMQDARAYSGSLTLQPGRYRHILLLENLLPEDGKLAWPGLQRAEMVRLSMDGITMGQETETTEGIAIERITLE